MLFVAFIISFCDATEAQLACVQMLDDYTGAAPACADKGQIAIATASASRFYSRSGMARDGGRVGPLLARKLQLQQRSRTGYFRRNIES